MQSPLGERNGGIVARNDAARDILDGGGAGQQDARALRADGAGVGQRRNS
jgi:hypothetical protein